MASITLILEATHLAPGDVLRSSSPRVNTRKVINYLEGLSSGAQRGSARIMAGSAVFAAATQTITCTQSAATANDTITILGVTLTAKSSGATGAQFNIGASNTAMADNMAAAINANATLSKYVLAAAATGVVTLTTFAKGELMNVLAGTTVSVNSGTPMVATSWANGAGGASTTYSDLLA